MDGVLPIKDPVLIFAMVAAIILLSPIILGRYRLPGMVGLLFAGALLGPNALGVLARDQSFILFGTVGLLYIMFMAALEIDLAAFKRYSVHSVAFGVLTFGLPQGLGYLFAHYLLDFAVLASVLLGSVFASHTLLAYPIASRLGIAKGQAVVTAVGGTILTDTLALLVLAVVEAGSVHGEMTRSFFIRLGASMSAYVLVILIGLPRLARWFFRRIAHDGVSEFVFVLAVVFGCASLSHLAGVEPILGAFLAGLALNRLIPHSSTLMSRIQFTGEAVFVPFFLLSVGMLLDLRVFLGGVRSWLIAIGMLVCVTVTKWLAAESMRFVLGYSKNEARVVFGLSIAHAAATLAATMVGHELGLFDDAVVNGAILMIIVTCVLAPLVVDKYGRELVAKSDPSADVPSGPSQRILVALANPARATPLLELAQLVRDPAQEHPVYPLTVVEEGPRAVEHVAVAEKMLAKAVVQLAAADVPTSPITRIDLSVAAGILRARRELRATEVLVGFPGPATPSELFFGSVLEKLLEDPHYTLIVGRLLTPLNTSRRVLLAVPPNIDQEASFVAAARIVKRLARELGAKVCLVSVKSHEQRVRKRLQAARPSVDIAQRSLEQWSDLRSTLRELSSDDDLVVLLGARPGRASYRATRDLPERITEELPRANVLVIYPGEPAVDAASLDAPARDLVTVLPETVLARVPGVSLQEVAQAMLRHAMRENAANDVDALAKKSLAGSELLAPGVVLMHAETPHVGKNLTLFATSQKGVPHVASDTLAHIFVLLLDPPGRDPTRHLARLAALARMFQDPAIVDRARTASDAKTLAALFAPAEVASEPSVRIVNA